MMKKSRVTGFFLGFCVLALGCRTSKQPSFPGYTRVSATTSAPYFINNDGVARTFGPQGDFISFSMIAQQSNSDYRMLAMITDCTSKVLSQGGTLYRADGKIANQVEADKEASSLDAASDIGKTALAACHIAEEKRTFGGEFDLSKALVSVAGNYDPTSRSSSVIVKTDSGNVEGKLASMLDSLECPATFVPV